MLASAEYNNPMKEIIRGANKIDTDYTYNPWNADGGRLLNISSTTPAGVFREGSQRVTKEISGERCDPGPGGEGANT